MCKANLDDLLAEQRNRTLFWRTKDGREIPLKDLDIRHLDNIIKMLIKQQNKEVKESLLAQECELALINGLILDDIC